jgi:RNA polymerase sigma factor (sigma-70 family)
MQERKMQTLSEKIVEWLPDLRCYSHALSGSQKRGDVRLKLFLEVLLEHRDALASSSDIRKDLYRLYHTVLHRLDLDIDIEGEEVETGSDQRLRNAVAALPQRAREVLLLTSLSGFDLTKVSEMLGIRRSGVERQLKEAQAMVQQRMSARILIIEDEHRDAAKIEQTLEEMGHTVVGVAHSDAAAIELARDTQPELVVADVHGAAGAEAARHVETTTDAPVVFLRPPHGRRSRGRAGARQKALRTRAGQRVSTQDIRSAIDEALPRPRVIAAHVLR